MHSHPIQPAYDTKHIKILEYDLVLPFIPKQDLHLSLMQDDAGGLTTGTTLWLGGQVRYKLMGRSTASLQFFVLTLLK